MARRFLPMRSDLPFFGQGWHPADPRMRSCSVKDILQGSAGKMTCRLPKPQQQKPAHEVLNLLLMVNAHLPDGLCSNVNEASWE